METIVKTLTLNKEQYYEVHLNIINGLLPSANKMTPMEVKVLSAFMSIEKVRILEGKAVEEDVFDTESRNIVKSKIDLSDGGLSNYIRSLKDKRLITSKGKGYIINPLLVPEKNEQRYQFKLIKSEEDR